MFYEGINANVFRRSIKFAIAVVVTSRSSSFEYTISVHAMRVGSERNVCNIVVSTETPPNFHEPISKAAPRVQTSTLTPAPPKVLTSKTPTTFSSALCADALQMLVSGLVYRPKYTWSVYHICVSSWTFWWNFKMHKLIWVVAHVISDKISCTDTFGVSKLKRRLQLSKCHIVGNLMSRLLYYA